MGLKCTSRVEVEITYEAIVEFVKKRLEGTGKELGTDITITAQDTDGAGDVFTAEITSTKPLTVSYTEVSEV